MTQQQSIGHQNAPVNRPPTLTIYDATKYVKQSQARLQSESAAAAAAAQTATANRNNNSNSIRSNIRKSNESVTSQENSSAETNRFPNARNRFNPSSTTKLPASSFGSNTNNHNHNHSNSISRAPAAQSQFTTPEPSNSSPTVAAVASSDANPPSTSSTFDQRQNRIPISSRFGTSREQNTSVRINKFLRQPIYASREANQQQTVKRINITHNGSANRDAASTSASVSQEVF